jgi:hypothetical protein
MMKISTRRLRARASSVLARVDGADSAVEAVGDPVGRDAAATSIAPTRRTRRCESSRLVSASPTSSVCPVEADAADPRVLRVAVEQLRELVDDGPRRVEHARRRPTPKLIAKPARIRIWLPSRSIAAVLSGQPSSSAMPLRVSASLGQRSGRRARRRRRCRGWPLAKAWRLALAVAAAGLGEASHLGGAGAGVLLQELQGLVGALVLRGGGGRGGHAPEAREGVEGEVRPHEVRAALEPVLRAGVEGREVVRGGLIELTQVALGGARRGGATCASCAR